jgi:hypothetical protein
VCSNAIQYSQMYTSVCPYQSDVCGHSSPVIEHSTGGALQNMQSRYGFFTDFTCSFEIKAPDGASEDSYIYFELLTL